MKLAWVAAILCAGCLEHNLVPCGDGFCPSELFCVSNRCASAEAIAKCNGMLDGSPCTTNLIAFDGYCVGEVCRQSICGNGDQEFGEVCDDGNRTNLDGCNAFCQSRETCGNGFIDTLAGEQCDDGIAGRSFDGCTSTCRVEVDSWQVAPRVRMPPIGEVAIATDTGRGRVVMFGGSDGIEVLDRTYEFDRDGWVERSPVTRPGARRRSAMAYDPMRSRVVMFGGADGGGGVLGDTWEWNGVDWTLRSPSVSPPARRDAAMAFDPVSHQIVLFGGLGTDASATSDTWLWNGTTWTMQGGASPTITHLHGMATAPALSGVVLVGGNPGTAPVAWRWDGSQWQQLATPLTSRTTAGVAYDPVRDRVIVYGGFAPNGQTIAETWSWDGAQWTRVGDGPSVGSMGLAFAPSRQEVISVGGVVVNNPRSDLTWSLGATAWTQVFDSDAGLRTLHAAAFDPLSGGLVIEGGFTGSVLHDTRRWSDNRWQSLADGPSLYGHSMVFDRARRELVLFGGFDGAALRAGTWALRGSTWTELSPATSPGPRVSAAIAYDAARRVVVLYGGRDQTGPLGDTWEWNGVTWTLRTPATSPPPLTATAMAYDEARAELVLFGGQVGPGMPSSGETWTWDGSDWSRRNTMAAPPPREGHAMAYSPDRRRVVMTGGVSGSLPLRDTWEWDGQAWSPRMVPVEPPPRIYAPLVYDPIAAAFWTYGGDSSDREVMRYGFTSVATPRETCVSGVDVDGDGLLGCNDPDCWGRCDPLCAPGMDQNCEPDRPHCGDGVCSILESYLLCPADCQAL